LVRILSDPISEQIYNIAADPYEKADLAASESPRLARMSQAMDKWIAMHPKGDFMSAVAPHPGWTPPKDWSKVAVE